MTPDQHPHDEIVAELESVALSTPASGRGQLAKVSALRTLLRLRKRDGLTEAERHLWDSDRDPNDLIDADDWQPGGCMADLDRFDTTAQRRAWWIRLYGAR